LVLRNGFSAIVDATFLRMIDRRAIEDVARSAAAPFIGMWLEAPEQTLVERLETRDRDASDADSAVLRTQLVRDVGAIGWHTLDSSTPFGALQQQALSLLEGRVNDAASGVVE
jgi:predicted kinase